MHLPTRATRACAFGRRCKASRVTGMWPCERASARCWTRAAYSCQGRPPVSGDQAQVREREGALSGSGLEHGETASSVHAVQLLDRAAHVAAGAVGISAPAVDQRTSNRVEFGRQADLAHSKSSSSGVGRTHSYFGGCCADLHLRATLSIKNASVALLTLMEYHQYEKK